MMTSALELPPSLVPWTAPQLTFRPAYACPILVADVPEFCHKSTKQRTDHVHVHSAGWPENRTLRPFHEESQCNHRQTHRDAVGNAKTEHAQKFYFPSGQNGGATDRWPDHTALRHHPLKTCIYDSLPYPDSRVTKRPSSLPLFECC